MSGRRRGEFTTTWWGRAWIEALEQRASLDPNRLPRGRTYARHGHVAGLELAPGAVSALVQGSRRQPYRVKVAMRQFTETDWDRLLDAVVARAAHAAALLDGDLDPGIVEDARAAGVELLPGAGDLRPRCSCPDWADPCKHSAAVCYLVARELDKDPFALLLLRGRPRDEILDEMRQRRRGATTVDAPAPGVPGEGADAGIRATEAWRREPGALPEVPAVRAHPGRLATWPVDPPPSAPFTAGGLIAVAEDAVERAWRMARGDTGSHLGLDPDADLARRSAARLDTATPPATLAELAAAAGIDRRTLTRRAEAWRHAGEDGLRVITESRWRPDPLLMAEARDRLAQLGVAVSRIRTDRNALTIGPRHFRLGHDGRWWPYQRRSNRWELAGPPADDIDELWTAE